VLTFKQFLNEDLLLEGGKATEKLGTKRATKEDIDAALKFVSRCTNVGVETLRERLLGSTRLTAGGAQADSGDIDIAINDGEVNREHVVKLMTKATGNAPHVTGGSTYSFAVPTIGDKKVQVDLMFVPDVEWAKFSHHSAEDSKHKSGVRNELLHSALKFSMESGKDVRIKDEAGNDIARASRAYKLDQGVERIFKVAPKRKDGKGRVKSVVQATPDEVQQVLDDIGDRSKFSHDADTIRDPAKFGKLLFGVDVGFKDMRSTEQLINLIKKYKADKAEAIFKDAVRGIKRLKFPVPEALSEYQ
jgi:hypothetical protein